MRVYIAGRYTAKDRLLHMATRLMAIVPEAQVTASWLRANEADYSEDDTDEERKGWAERDVREINEATFLILDTIDESITGGREVEFGMFYARDPKAIVIIGPRRNVFHALADRYDTWEDYFAMLKGHSVLEIS